ncbi:hypothetical protein G7Y89_g9397 [Cudoniella acicularis]|uniref:C2H2-type domain-containing protein n=1 Tax=Cudoniella acicularis TaxID=354080 RepID=A0A8H4RGA1_9HELO|nr:hypothetical protein G7Y89_g9397 [Cudoniella acicularis]
MRSNAPGMGAQKSASSKSNANSDPGDPRDPVIRYIHHLYSHIVFLLTLHRPYACQEPQCNGLDFGDKGELQRHEKENHRAEKFCCTIRGCPRSIRGFGRKRNLDLHFLSKHRAGVTGAIVGGERTINKEVEMNSNIVGSHNRDDGSELNMGDGSVGGSCCAGGHGKFASDFTGVGGEKDVIGGESGEG